MIDVPPVVGDAEPSFWQALRAAAEALVDDVVRFFLLAALWVLIGLGALALGSVRVGFHGLLLLLLPLTAVLGRMAVRTVHEHPARVRDGIDGARRRMLLQWGIGAAQLAVFALTWLNIAVALASPRLGLVVAAAASCNITLAVAAVTFVLWPLVLDPARADVPVRELLRTALTVVALRPGRILLTLVFVAVAAAVGLQTVVFAVPLVALSVLVAAHVMLPLADRVA